MRRIEYIIVAFTLIFLHNSIIAPSSTYAQVSKKSVDIPYPKPLPDSTALTFLPQLVSGDSLDFNACFSPDGKSFYFSRSKNKQSKIYVSHHDGTNWTEPVLASFTGHTLYAEADPIFSPDGKLYFISNRLTGPLDTLQDYDIWFVAPQPNGTWSEPKNLVNVNSGSNEFYISFSKSGNLYFASSRAGGYGEEDIYVSKLIRGQYTKPENLGPAVNTSKSEYDPCISLNENLVVFTSSGRPDSFGAADLYFAKRKNKQWLQAVNLGASFNTKTREFCPYFSPDSNYFFYSSEGNVKWIDMKYLKQQTDKLH
jgi:Tol biopolymer transport system component